MIRILVAEDDTAMNKLICSMLAEKGYDPAYGARPLKRTIQSMLQNAVADEILDERPSDRDELVVTGADGKVEVNVKKGIRNRELLPV